MYAISRIQAKPGIWCWAVQFSRRGKPYYKSFYDVRRGGSRNALKAAIAWRDQQLAQANTLSLREFRQVKRSDNRSGAVGVISMRVIALIENAEIVRRILEHFGLWAPLPTERSPPLAAASWPRHANLPLTYHPLPDIA